MNKINVRILILSLLSLTTIFSFQNCSSPVSKNNASVGSNASDIQVIPFGNNETLGSPSVGLDNNMIANQNPTTAVTSNTVVTPEMLALYTEQITDFYHTYLGRDPSSTGLNYWIEDITIRGQSLQQVESNILMSTEAEVRRLYLRHLGREPDRPGIEYWVGQIVNNGRSLEQVSNDLANSTEAAIRGYYLKYLGREPDRSGIEYWADEVEFNGQTLAQVEAHIRSSAEGNQRLVQTQIAVRSYYLTYLGREPDQLGFDFWVERVTQGVQTLVQVEQSIMNSPEAIIRGFYLTHLQREPDIEGLRYWVDDVTSRGQTFNQVRDNIRRSIECKINCL